MFTKLLNRIPGASSMPRTKTTEEQSLLDGPCLSSASTAMYGTYHADKEANHFENLSDFEMKAIVDQHAGYSAGPSIRRVAFDTTMKTLPSHEAYEAHIMAVVAESTSIPVPRVRRVYEQQQRTHILMEHIDGIDLINAWPRLPLWRKLYIAWLVRGYVKQLRRIKLPHPDVPGPFDGTGKPFNCKGHFFTNDGAGPFSSHCDMREWFHRKHRIAKTAQKRHGLKRSRAEFVDHDPLVLVNGNINPRGIRLGTDGTVWLMDWSLAGLYPKSFEYCSIMADGQLPDTPRLWTRLAHWIASGRSNKRQWEFLCSIKLALLFPYDESDFLW